jgi:hypothetical protein
VLARQDSPTLVVGHSYGGQIITALRTDAPNVGLVYIAAFGPDEGESIVALLARGSPTPAPAHLDIDEQGSGRRRRSGHPARCRAPVRRPHGATTVEIPTNHVAMVSHPDDVLQLIETTTEAVRRAWCRRCAPGLPGDMASRLRLGTGATRSGCGVNHPFRGSDS